MPIYEPGMPSPDPTWKIIMIYGDLGARKTSVAMTSKDSILFDFNQGSGKAYNSKNKHRMIIEKGWEEVAHFARNGAFDRFKTIIIDTAQDALNRFLSDAIMREFPALREKNGGLSQQGYGVLFRTFQEEFLNFLDGKILIVIAHADSEEINGVRRMTPLISGKTGQFLGSLAELIGYVNKVDDKVYIDFSSSGSFVSKGKEGLGRIEIPHYSDPSWPTFFQDQIIDKLGWKEAVSAPAANHTPTPTPTVQKSDDIGVPTPSLQQSPQPQEKPTQSNSSTVSPTQVSPTEHKPAVNISVPPPPGDDETALVSEWTQRLKAIKNIEELNKAIFDKKQIVFQKGPNDVLLRSILKEKIKELGAILDKATGIYNSKPVQAATE